MSSALFMHGVKHIDKPRAKAKEALAVEASRGGGKMAQLMTGTARDPRAKRGSIGTASTAQEPPIFLSKFDFYLEPIERQ